MTIALVVTEPFGDFAKGDQIRDADAIAGALDSHSAHVVRVELDDEPAPAKPAKSSATDAPAA